jgi:Uma2 family endonuclease
MVAVVHDPSAAALAERRRRGMDKFDERWAGEWHFVNPAKPWHSLLSGALQEVLRPLAEARGLMAVGDGMGMFGSPTDWRVPDQTYFPPHALTEVGVSTAALVVELRSPGDDSYLKLPFYAARQVGEVLVVDSDRRVELFRLARGRMDVVVPGADGSVSSAALDATFTQVRGPALCISWSSGVAQV